MSEADVGVDYNSQPNAKDAIILDQGKSAIQSNDDQPRDKSASGLLNKSDSVPLLGQKQATDPQDISRNEEKTATKPEKTSTSVPSVPKQEEQKEELEGFE